MQTPTKMTSSSLRILTLLILLSPYGLAGDGVTKINEFIEAKWQQAEIQPASKTSDEVFVRRVYLDLVGRIPTVGGATNLSG